MALDFPSSPSFRDTYTYGGVTWTWTGTAWDIVSALSDMTSHGLHVITGGNAGALVVGSGSTRFYAWTPLTIQSVIVSVGTAPTGAPIIFDINKNGTTIFTTQANRPNILAGGNYGVASNPDVFLLDTYDYLTIDIDQVGSTIAGADAVIQIVYY